MARRNQGFLGIQPEMISNTVPFVEQRRQLGGEGAIRRPGQVRTAGQSRRRGHERVAVEVRSESPSSSRLTPVVVNAVGASPRCLRERRWLTLGAGAGASRRQSPRSRSRARLFFF